MNLHPLYRLTMPYFRRARMRTFTASFTIDGNTSILDVGGSPDNWEWVDPRPRVTLLNLSSGHIWADGRRLPFRDDSFDIVFSNSTIEHVGSAADQVAFASEVMRVGRNFFVQTPNRSFPLEPHYLTPFVQFTPVRLRSRVGRNLTVWGLLTRPSPDDLEQMASVRLMSERELRTMFPPAEVRREQFLGLTKSLLAIHRADG